MNCFKNRICIIKSKRFSVIVIGNLHKNFKECLITHLNSCRKKFKKNLKVD